jgi:putative ABC transport system substrate-binding protein
VLSYRDQPTAPHCTTGLQLRADVLLVGIDPFFFSRQDQIVVLASRHAVPAIYECREYVSAGGLISYGTASSVPIDSLAFTPEGFLRARNPPICRSSNRRTFELVINLKTAKALGLTVPQSLLQRADEVIE